MCKGLCLEVFSFAKQHPMSYKTRFAPLASTAFITSCPTALSQQMYANKANGSRKRLHQSEAALWAQVMWYETVAEDLEYEFLLETAVNQQ